MAFSTSFHDNPGIDHAGVALFSGGALLVRTHGEQA